MTEQLSPEHAGDDHASTLYAKLLGETAPIAWQELQPFFARGVVLWVAATLDLIAVALAVAEDDKASISAWLAAGQVNALSAAGRGSAGPRPVVVGGGGGALGAGAGTHGAYRAALI